MSREANKNERLAARAIVRTLDACGDNVEKKERFVAMTLRDQSLAVEDHQETIRALRKMILGRDGKRLRRNGKLSRKSWR